MSTPSQAFIEESFKVSSQHAIFVLLAFNFTFQEGSAQGGASGSITLNSRASSEDGEYIGREVTIFAGTGSGQSRTITAYNGSTKVANVSPNWTTPPDVTSVYKVGATNRYVNNNENMTSNGAVYEAREFELDLPESTEERLPDVSILFDNVDLALARNLREQNGTPPTVTLSVITTIDPDVIEYGPMTLTVKAAGNKDSTTLEIGTGVEDLLNRSALPIGYTPGVTPGVLYI